MKRKVEFEIETENLGKKKIICFEVCPEVLINEIREKLETKKDENLPLTDFLDLLRHCCSLTLDEIKKLYPSEKKIVFDKFKEANSDFFLTYPKVQELIKKLGIIDFLVEIAKELKLLNILKAIITESWSGSLNKPSAD